MVDILKDLRPRFAGARDQGQRPTCIAFAASDVHALSRVQPFEPLSVEYLYYHAVQRSQPPDPDAGVTLCALRSALKDDGQPLESAWPYLQALPKDRSAWHPPTNVNAFTVDTDNKNFPMSDIISAIDGEFSPMLVVRISEAFCQPDAAGIVPFLPSDPDVGYHALVGAGHGRVGNEPLILVRNSWGPTWGIDGYGWVFTSYLQSRLHSVSFAVPPSKS